MDAKMGKGVGGTGVPPVFFSRFRKSRVGRASLPAANPGNGA